MLAMRWILFGLAILAGPWSAARADLLSQVLARGVLRCGVTESGPGFSYVDARGERAGMEVDNCKTISAALFGAVKVQYVIVSPQTVFTMVQSGGIDLFAGGATWSFLRDVTLGVDFTGVYFYDGQGFMVRKASGIARVADLDGATICITQGTTLEQNLADYFLAHGMKYDVVTFANAEMAMQAYRTDRCDALSMQRAALAARRTAMPDPAAHVILAEMISSEPQAAVVRQGDARWRDVVLWAFNVRVAAEEMGINQVNVDGARARGNSAEVKRLLGVQGNFGKTLGLRNDWAYDVVRLVGNYADMWERNFAPIGLERGANALWRDGGLMTALPFR
jgi:general L-amino acid transport system substrate-binding protein